MGTPWVELPRDTIRHACGVAHVVSLTKPTATFHPRPILGSGFYATAYVIPCWLKNIINNRWRNKEMLRRSSAWQRFEYAKVLSFRAPARNLINGWR